MAEPNTTELRRLRRKLDHSQTSLGDAEAEDLFAEAEERYPGYSRAVILAAAVWLGWQDLAAHAAKEVTIRENAASENLSDLFKHAQQQVKDSKQALDALVATDAAHTAVVVRFGGVRRKPTRKMELPDS